MMWPSFPSYSVASSITWEKAGISRVSRSPEEGCEPLVKVAQVHFTRFDSIVEVKGDRVKLTESPENLIFLDKALC